MASGKDSQFIRDLSEKRLLGSGSGADLLHRNSDLGTPSNRSWWKFGRQPSEIKPPAANIQTEQPQLPVETAAAASDSHLQQEIDRLKVCRLIKSVLPTSFICYRVKTGKLKLKMDV